MKETKKSAGIFYWLKRQELWICVGISAIFLYTGFICASIAWLAKGVSDELFYLLTSRDHSIPLTSPKNLLLSNGDFPDDWELGTDMNIPQSSFQYTGDAAGRWYRHPANVEYKESLPAYHVVGRYGSVKGAEREVNSLKSIFESGQQVNWTFESHEDDFVYNCVISEGVRGEAITCRFVMRYDEYVSYLMIVPEYTGVDSAEIATILTNLDQKFAAIETSR